MANKINSTVTEQITHLFVNENKRPNEIAILLDISKPTVHNHLQKNNLTKKRVILDFSEELKEKAITLYKQGKSYGFISKEIKIPETTTKRFLKKLGLFGNFDMTLKVKGDLEIKVEKLHNQGLTTQQIGKELKISTGAINNWYKNNHLTSNERTYISLLDSKKDLIFDLISKKYGVEDIGRELNIGGGTVRTWLIKNKIHIDKYKTKKHVEDRKIMLKYVQNFVVSEKDQLISEKYHDNVKHLTFKCKKDHKFSMSWFNYQKGHRCPKCSVLSSKAQLEIYDFIKSIYEDGEVLYNNKTAIKPLELDIYIPDFKLGIEFNGLYWHCELHKDKKNHVDKYKQCLEKSIKLMAIFEDEWINKKELVKQMIKGRLGIKECKLRASKLEVKKIEKNGEFNWFFDKFHLDGHVNAKYAYGLFFEDKMVCCASFRTSIKNKKLEIARFASDYNYHIYGGLGKILNKLQETYSGDLISYSNNRLSHGNIYNKLDFKEITETLEPSYWYTDFKTRLFRTKCKKINDKEVVDVFKTEREQALNGIFSLKYLGHNRPLYKVYDYGHRKWVKTL